MKNKKILLGVALAVIAGLLLYKKVKADIGGEIGVSYVSEHLFRGTVKSSNNVQGSIGTAVSVIDGLVVDVEGLYTGSVDGDTRELDVDLGTSFTVTKGLQFNAGTVIYEYFNSSLSTDVELYAGLQLTAVPLQPNVTLFHNTRTDVNTVEGSIVKDLDVGIEDLSVDVTGVVGDSGGVTYYGAVLGARYSVTDELSLTANLATVKNYTEGNKDTSYTVGLNYLF